jgi:hypothetical protein
MICRFHHGVFIVIDHASHHVWSISMMNQKREKFTTMKVQMEAKERRWQ